MTVGEQQLELLRQAGMLQPLDVHFAHFVRELEGEASAALMLATAMVSRATGEGHVCLDLGLAWRELSGLGVRPATDLDAWLAGLRLCATVGAPGAYKPLVLDDAGLLYLHRYWRYEETLAEALLSRARERVATVDGPAAAEALGRLFPAATVSPDWQKIAAACALLRRFCVISGGPGTGKTSTVARVLCLLIEQGGSTQRIALAAPTGKAAARLQDSLRAARAGLPVADEVRAAMPEEVQTLHRLLGAGGDELSFRYHRENPLPLDTLVVDEASMVDIALMSKLLEALPAAARLILLGDKDQLASVEAGAVLGDICAAAHGFSEDFRQRLARLTGDTLPPADAQVSPVSDSVVLLHHSYRFGADSAIGRLAGAVRDGQAEQAWTQLTQGTDSDVSYRPDDGDFVPAIARGYRDFLRLIAEGAGPEEVFAAFDAYRVLAVLRRGPRGIEGLNQAIETVLGQEGLIRPRQPWYRGRPLMVSRNDYGLRLYNGDVGIVLPDPTAFGRLAVCVASAEGYRWVPTVRLPEHETAWAVTVHKAQGSEFDRVSLVLPEKAVPVLSRELIYTAITRARREFEMAGAEAVLLSALGSSCQRRSGLRRRLGAGVSDG